MEVSSSSNGQAEASNLLSKLQLKDLDTGKVCIIPEEHIIKDLSTGQLFALREDLPPSADNLQIFTDFASGRELNAEEMDIVLGLRPDPKKLRRDSQGSTPRRSSASQKEGAARKAKRWLKMPFKSNKHLEAEESESESPASTPHADQGRSNSIAGSTSSFRPERSLIRVTAHKKVPKELANLQLIQELPAHESMVWAAKFNLDGRFLATAGQDGRVLVWEMAVSSVAGEAPDGSSNGQASDPTSAEAEVNVDRQGSANSPGSRQDGPVLKNRPFKTYSGHTRDVLDLSWSSTGFLLSASMDTTVRLWHTQVDQCLRVFRHTDFIPAVAFHPRNDQIFASGSLDCKIRVWNIPNREQGVIDFADMHEIVTAVTFSADGSQLMAGSLKGKCQFYTCSSDYMLQYQAQIDVKDRRATASTAKKITGIQLVPGKPQQIMITSNDSRIRVYEHYALICKYKGLHNANTQIKASFSSDGSYIICGSDDGACVVWNNVGAGSKEVQQSAPFDHIAEKCASYERFQAADAIQTVAIFAPDSLQRLLREHLRNSVKSDGEDSGTALSKAFVFTAGFDGVIRVFANNL